MSVLAATGHLGLTRPGDAEGFEVLGFVLFLFMAVVFPIACYRVDLDENRIRIRRPLFPTRKIELSEIKSVEFRTHLGSQDRYDSLTVRSNDCRITFTSDINHYRHLRDAILDRVPSERIRHG
jgi:hypothetical protein